MGNESKSIIIKESAGRTVQYIMVLTEQKLKPTHNKKHTQKERKEKCKTKKHI